METDRNSKTGAEEGRKDFRTLALCIWAPFIAFLFLIDPVIRVLPVEHPNTSVGVDPSISVSEFLVTAPVYAAIGYAVAVLVLYGLGWLVKRAAQEPPRSWSNMESEASSCNRQPTADITGTAQQGSRALRSVSAEL